MIEPAALRRVGWGRLAAVPLLFVALTAPLYVPINLTSPVIAGRPVPLGATPATAPAIGFLDFHLSGRRPPDLNDARAINAGIPMANAPARIATPFFVSGANADQARAVDCLAAAGYYEAGDDAGGQRAVMQVVLNRVRNPAFPQTICGVVFQGAERRTGCQFTFTCDGAMARYRPSPAAWLRVRQTAIAALSGYIDARVGHATHYHTDWVHPYWSATLDKVAAVDTHLFFQPNARAPGNFSAAYISAEPRIARLASLSLAHLPDGLPAAPLPVTISLATAIAPTALTIANAVEMLPDRVEAPGEGVFLVTLDASAHPDSFRRQAEARCAGLARCKFIGWTDASRRVAQFPLPGRAIDAITFSFSRAGAGEAVSARWNCREFPRARHSECLRHSMPEPNTAGSQNDPTERTGV